MLADRMTGLIEGSFSPILVPGRWKEAESAPEAEEDPGGQNDRQHRLDDARQAAAAADRGGDGDGGEGKQDVAKVDVAFVNRVAEPETEGVSQRVVRHDHQRRHVQPDDRQVGKCEENAAEEAVVVAKSLRRVCVRAAWPRLAVDHVMEVPRDDGHDKPADEDADHRAERSGLWQEIVPGHDERVGPHGAAEGERPRA